MKKLLLILIGLLAVSCLFAQNHIGVKTDVGLFTTANTSRPAYLGIAVGVQYSMFRDFATSPLFYTGTPTHIALSHTDFNDKRASSFQFAYAFGNFKSNTIQEVAVSKVDIFSINYLELFELSGLSNSRINLKIGGQFNTVVNIRDNEALGNNSDGFEVISTLFGAIKSTIHLNRNPNKSRNDLAFGVNIGLINSAYRNGFIYTRHSPLLNQDDINEGYAFQVFSGYRLNSTVAYTAWLQNGNALQLSYHWDMYHTGNRQAAFEMATHLFNCTLLFHLN